MTLANNLVLTSVAKYYIYCASRDRENFYFEAFLAYLKSKLSKEKSKCEFKNLLNLNFNKIMIIMIII